MILTEGGMGKKHDTYIWHGFQIYLSRSKSY